VDSPNTDTLKDGLIARLSAQVSEFYEQSLAAAMTSVNIPSDWITHITAKKLHFYSAAQYRKSIEAVSGSAIGRYGEEVARLHEALRNVDKALERKNFLGRGVREDLLGLQTILRQASERAEKDNDLIYLGICILWFSDIRSCTDILIIASYCESTNGKTDSLIGREDSCSRGYRTIIISITHSLRGSPIYCSIQ
jgi:programmed cell death 6-interacting protein